MDRISDSGSEGWGSIPHGSTMKSRCYKCILGLLMMTLYLGYASSTQLFTHFHYYSWGVVSHSHPFTDAEHTASGCNFISLITSSIAEEAESFSFFPLQMVLIAVILVMVKRVASSKIIHSWNLRAPPVSIS